MSQIKVICFLVVVLLVLNQVNAKCLTNADCCNGYTCTSGFCHCGSPSTPIMCASGYICNQGSCVLSSFPMKNCPANKICTYGECSAICCDGYTLTNGNCQCGTPPVICKPRSICLRNACFPGIIYKNNCPNGLICQYGQCVDLCSNVTCCNGYSCTNGFCHCGSPSYPTICGSGYICNQGSCVLSSLPMKNCPFGWICKFGECTNPCKVNCCDGYQCLDGYCHCGPSTAPIMCAAGYKCFNSICQPGLSINTCPTGSLCLFGQCIP